MAEGLAIETIVLGDAIRRELTDADLERVVEVAREVSAEWGDMIAARAKENPEQVKESLRGGARRLLALTALKDRAPKVFAAKVVELRAQGETTRAVADLRKAEGDPAGAPEAVEAARAALDAAAARQVEATIAARAEELSALEQYIERMRKDLARDGGSVDALAQEIVKRARERGARRGDGPDAPPPDAPPPQP
jgi:transcription initiation factor TFIIIB Brf1 subunit/transcription initiation factor TFIIB